MFPMWVHAQREHARLRLVCADAGGRAPALLGKPTDLEGVVLVRSWNCPGTVIVLFRDCTGTVLVLALVACWHCAALVPNLHVIALYSDCTSSTVVPQDVDVWPKIMDRSGSAARRCGNGNTVNKDASPMNVTFWLKVHWRTSLALSWYYTGTVLDWHQAWTVLALCCACSSAAMVLTWSCNGTAMALCWPCGELLASTLDSTNTVRLLLSCSGRLGWTQSPTLPKRAQYKQRNKT